MEGYLFSHTSGLPIGTLDGVDIGKAVLKKIGLNLPEQLIKSARKDNIYQTKFK